MDNMTIFDMMYPTFKIDKPIRLIELFAGVGSQAMALRDLGADFEHYRIAEWEVSAFKSYKAIHMLGDNTDYSKDISKDDLPQILFNYGISTNGKDPMTLKEIQRKGEKWQRETYNNIKATNNLCSVCNFHGQDLAITDTNKYCYILTYSFPCFTGDTLVLTDKGYKQIKNMQVGDYVLTHNNRYKKVLKTMNNGKKPIYKLKAMPVDEIKCTKDHRFYVREMYRTYPRKEDGKRTRKRNFKTPEWLPLSQLNKNHYIGVAINQKSEFPKWEGIVFRWKDGRKSRIKNQLSSLMDNYSFWWLIGRYIGDGWQRTQGGIIICCSKKELKDMPTHLRNCGLNYNVVEEKTVYKFHIPLKELQEFTTQFGIGAFNKHLTDMIYNLPIDYLKSFLDGYISADGCVLKDGVYKISTISRELAYGIGQCVAKAYKTPYRIYKTQRSDTCVIEGRIVNSKNDFQVVWKLKKNKQDKAFYEDGYVWFPIQDIEQTSEEATVYDIEVEDDHSFTANGVIVHNCQDLSVAGKMQGMSKGSGTRSGLLWEVERLLNEINELPQVLLMENVPQVISRKNMSDFHKWQEFLEDKGYTNYVEILNAKNFGVAQNRERCFMVSLLGKWNYKFPQPIPLTKTMKDYLEDEVDEKYYINSDKANNLIQQLMESGQLQKTQEISYCLDANYWKGTTVEDFTNKNRRQLVCADLSINNPKVTNISNCITARQDRGISNHQGVGGAVVEQIRQIGNYETESTWDNPQTGRVYSADGISPTLNTCGGGDREVKIIEPVYGIYTNVSEDFQAGPLKNLSRCLKAEKHDASVIYQESMIVASRGRNPQNPSDRTPGNHVEQRLEPNSEGLCNTLTSVQKDNLVLEPAILTPITATETGICRIETPYRIRKLTPLECWRLMDFTDEDFYKAKLVIEIAESKDFIEQTEEKVNKILNSSLAESKKLYHIKNLSVKIRERMSNTQLYKQAGNSIVKAVLMAIFKQMM